MINIIETELNDVTKNNINKSKLNLSEKIIQQIYPLFDEVYTEKENKYNELQDNISINHKKLIDKKSELDSLMENIKRKRKVVKLLQRLEKLIYSDIPFETSIKHETIILLKTIDKMSNERLDYNLNRTMKLISKTFVNK